MTPKQKKFIREIVAGKNPSEAYRSAYNTENMSAKAISTEANKLMNNPDIAMKIDIAEAEAVSDAVWTRREAIAQLRAVNDRIFRAITCNSNTVPNYKILVNALLETIDRLNSLADVDFELEIRRKAYKQGADSLNMDFDNYEAGLRALYQFDSADFNLTNDEQE